MIIVYIHNPNPYPQLNNYLLTINKQQIGVYWGKILIKITGP